MNNLDEAVRIDSGAPVAEDMPSLADVADEVGDGAWPAGWYKADILAGFKSAKGRLFETQDTPSKNGDSRNLTVTLKITNVKTGKSRNMFTSRNYRIEDFSQVAAVKAGTADKRTSISLAKLGQLEKALGQGFKRHPEGYILVAPLVGRSMDVRLAIGDNGFNEANAFAPAGTKAK